MEHLSEAAEGNELLSMVRKHEENGIVRLGREFKTRITELSESSNVVEGTKKIQKKYGYGKRLMATTKSK